MGSIAEAKDALIRIVLRREMRGMLKSLAVSVAVLSTHPHLFGVT